MLFLGVTDAGPDRRPSSELTPDFGRRAPFLPLRIHAQPVFRQSVVALVSGVEKGAPNRHIHACLLTLQQLQGPYRTPSKIMRGAKMACCHNSSCSSNAGSDALNSPGWRRALQIALIVNAGFFVVEAAAGVTAGSVALQADALDFFGDAANYAVSLGVAGMALTWRARAAIAKGGTLIAFALWVLGCAAWRALYGALPQAEVMSVVAIAALITNGGVALTLYRFRTGDANMRSVWICSRNDAVGNVAVLLAALGVFGAGAGWPDVIVAMIMGGLGLSGGWQIVSQARRELRPVSAQQVAAAE
jgi:Co/Zn/Cd efflux system component